MTRALPHDVPPRSRGPHVASGPLPRLAVLALLALPAVAPAQELSFGPPQFLPGDTLQGLADGHQEQVEIAAGADGSLAVWSDMRSSLDDFQGLDGSGPDIYGALLDADGAVVQCFLIDDGPGDQILPHVAWNGSQWLVAWMEPQPSGLPIFERIRAVRVAPDGTVLDPEPIVVHVETWGCYCSYFGLSVAGGDDGWVVVFPSPPDGLYAVHVRGDGVVEDPAGVQLSGESGLAWDIAFAQDEYLIVFGDGLQARAQRYSPTLQFLGQTSLPFAKEVATDGTDFLVIGQWDFSWPPQLEALLLGHDGSVLKPRFTVATGNAVTGPSGERVGYDGNNYWVHWAGDQFARVRPTGQLLDPEGFVLSPPSGSFGWEPALTTAPGGGVQVAWNLGGGGAGNPEDLYTARITPDALVVDETALSVSAPAQVEPHLAAGDGVHMVVFRSRSSGAARILAQRLDDSGQVLDAEPIEVASGPLQWLEAPTLDAPQVAWNGTHFLVVWSDTIDVLGRRLLPDGTFVDAAPLVIMPGQGAAVGALGEDFLVGGSTVGTLLAKGALRVARVDGPTGAVLDSPPINLSGSTLTGRHAHIEALAGRWLVVWESVYYDQHSTTTIESTAYAFVEADGSTTGQLGADLSERPGVGVSGDRALIVAVDTTVPGGSTNLEARLLMADGSFLGPTFALSTAPDEQLWPTATWTGSWFLAAWEDKRQATIHFDERTDVYGARVTATGEVLDPAGLPLASAPQVEIRPAFLETDVTTLLAVSTLRTDDPATSSFRVGLQALDGPLCQTDLGFGGPGDTRLSVCGEALASGGSADLSISDAPPHTSAWVSASTVFAPTAFKGGQLVTVPLQLIVPLTTDAAGSASLPGLAGGGGPFDAYVQVVVADPAQLNGFGLSNAVQVAFLP